MREPWVVGREELGLDGDFQHGGGAREVACLEQSLGHLNRVVLLALPLFAEFDLALRLKEGVGEPGILADGGKCLTRKIDGVGQLLALHHPLNFAQTLFQ